MSGNATRALPYHSGYLYGFHSHLYIQGDFEWYHSVRVNGVGKKHSVNAMFAVGHAAALYLVEVSFDNVQCITMQTPEA
jgi:hypothetical protein